MKFSLNIIFGKISFPYQIPDQNNIHLTLKITRDVVR